ncbi:DNA-templated transcription, initiation [Trichomonas vaginalis G3]|nr:DNA-templated transcription, initiation [Trichomonas vaginalis G3]KAI5518579.1 DNA-templated transcription, initiation [Trichomonas vaginalis G3]
MKWYKELENDADITVSTTEDITSLKPKVVNVIALAQYSCNKLNLVSIASTIRNAEYKPKRIKAVVIRIRDPKATGLVFSNGKINIVGCRSVEDAKRAAHKFRKMLQQIGYDVKLVNITISSIVATIHTPFNIAIAQIASADGHKLFCQYRPEKFAGLIYRLTDPQCTMLIFQSGSIVLTAKSEDDLTAGSNWIYPVLQKFEKKSMSELLI